MIDRCGLVAEACTVICRDGLAVCWNRIRRHRRTRHDKLSGPYSSVERTQVLVASRSEIAAIAAGIFDTDLAQTLPQRLLQMHDFWVSAGRLGRPSELAEFAAFMVSDRNSFMNAEVVIVDGGAIT